MTINAQPSKDPADDGTLAGMTRVALRKALQQTDVMLPAVVLAYDRASNVATVKPLISLLTTTDLNVPRAQVARVPVIALGGGGTVINFPIKPGDLGWIEASDRDISLYTQTLNEAPPNTTRMHSFEDGRFIPDVMRSYDVTRTGSDDLTIQTTDGNVRIEVGPAAALITHGGVSIRVDASGVTVTAPQVTVDSPTASFTGNVIVSGEATIGGIPFTTHRHTAQGATAITTPPVP